MKLIITVGMPGSGKEEFLKAAMEFGCRFIRMGDVVREHYANRSSEDSNLSVSQFADVERRRYGPGIWAMRTIKEMFGFTVMIDGCRSMGEIETYKKIADDVRIIGIFASPEIRYKRLIERARNDAPKNIYEFQMRDRREMSWGLAEALALADRVIVNESSLSDFKDSVGSIVREILK